MLNWKTHAALGCPSGCHQHSYTGPAYKAFSFSWDNVQCIYKARSCRRGMFLLLNLCQPEIFPILMSSATNSPMQQVTWQPRSVTKFWLMTGQCSLKRESPPVPVTKATRFLTSYIHLYFLEKSISQTFLMIRWLGIRAFPSWDFSTYPGGLPFTLTLYIILLSSLHSLKMLPFYWI